MRMNKQQEITTLSNSRENLLYEQEASWNEDTCKYDYDSKEIDVLGVKIHSMLNEHKEELPVDFIIEELTKLGHAPCLMYDDNGNFAVTGDGFQELSDDDTCDMSIYTFIKKEQWKPTVREALYDYLKD